MFIRILHLNSCFNTFKAYCTITTACFYYSNQDYRGNFSSGGGAFKFRKILQHRLAKYLLIFPGNCARLANSLGGVHRSPPVEFTGESMSVGWNAVYIIHIACRDTLVGKKTTFIIVFVEIYFTFFPPSFMCSNKITIYLSKPTDWRQNECDALPAKDSRYIRYLTTPSSLNKHKYVIVYTKWRHYLLRVYCCNTLAKSQFVQRKPQFCCCCYLCEMGTKT